MQCPAALRQLHPVAPQGIWASGASSRSGRLAGGAGVVAQERRDVAQRNRLDRRLRSRDLELAVEQELDRTAAQQQHPVVHRQAPARGVELDLEPVGDGHPCRPGGTRRRALGSHRQLRSGEADGDKGEQQSAAAKAHCMLPGGGAGAGGWGAAGGSGAAGGTGGSDAFSGVRRK